MNFSCGCEDCATSQAFRLRSVMMRHCRTQTLPASRKTRVHSRIWENLGDMVQRTWVIYLTVAPTVQAFCFWRPVHCPIWLLSHSWIFDSHNIVRVLFPSSCGHHSGVFINAKKESLRTFHSLAFLFQLYKIQGNNLGVVMVFILSLNLVLWGSHSWQDRMYFFASCFMLGHVTILVGFL